MKRFTVLAAAFCFLVGTQAQAADTPWLSQPDFERYLSERLNDGKVIPTSIDCRAHGGGLQIRIGYRPFSMSKPFHKWNYVIAPREHLNRAVAALKRSDRFDLEYRVVAEDSILSGDGVEWVCAIAFR